MSELPISYKIADLLSDNDRYIIPMYQRNYAWEEGEINQLIQDILDYLPTGGKPEKPYYIGSLVVFRREDRDAAGDLFETIDGQQRLTTLLLLASYLRNKDCEQKPLPPGKLRFDSREKSSYTLDAIISRRYGDDPGLAADPSKMNPAILNGYRLIKKKLDDLDTDSLQRFSKFLFGHVEIIRVEVPEDTDLNHYFEIMNNRGEQLEKHEVLKAQLLGVIENDPDMVEKKSATDCIHAVWEACSNMERYVQMGFQPDIRSVIFGDVWSSFTPENFDELAEQMRLAKLKQDQGSVEAANLGSIIGSAGEFIRAERSNDGANPSERFHSPINFPNFLLHVLRVMDRDVSALHEETREDIGLDDKNLLPSFKNHIISKGSGKVKEFIHALLKCKWLLDHFVLKRDFSEAHGGAWSLKELIKSDQQNSAYYRQTFHADGGGAKGNADRDSKRILMLLSAFHVSTPTMVYKHWLSAALHYLFQARGPVQAKDYLTYLESIAHAFVFDRDLATEKKEYFDIIFREPRQDRGRTEPAEDSILEERLTFGARVTNFTFNYLDYLLWLKHDDGKNKKIAEFKFTFRSSVEHFYPQNPDKIAHMPTAELNSFGNLCLISHSKNSRLSNFTPMSKKSDYQGESIPIDSIKQHLMMEATTEKTPWDEERIRAHTEDMIGVLKAGVPL